MYDTHMVDLLTLMTGHLIDLMKLESGYAIHPGVSLSSLFPSSAWCETGRDVNGTSILRLPGGFESLKSKSGPLFGPR